MKKKFKLQSGTVVSIDTDKEISRGGEGAIFLCEENKQKVIKIYHPGVKAIRKDKFDKLQMIKSKNFVKPEDLVYDSSGTVVGFTMTYIDPSFYQLSAIFNKTFCSQHGIDQKFKTELAKNLIRSVEELHSQSIAIGDLSGFNTLINDKGDIRFIDVDSYDVPPSNVHNGKLLFDITDFLYNGKVSKESDYFALAVVIFNFFCNLHPYKGIHKTYGDKIKERMIRKASVLLTDGTMTIPKCYVPIADPYIKEQFVRIFQNGERFLIKLDKVTSNITIIPPVQTIQSQSITEKDLIVKNIFFGEKIEFSDFTQKMGLIQTDKFFYIYDLRTKGQYALRFKIEKFKFERIFIGNENVIGIFGTKMYQILTENTRVQMENVELYNLMYHKYENIIVMNDTSKLYKFHIDNIFGKHILYTIEDIYGPSFQHKNSLIQKNSGSSVIFYNSGIEISGLPVHFDINWLKQTKNVGIVSFFDKNTMNLNRHFFRIERNKMIMDGRNITEDIDLGFISTGDENGFILEPMDDKIRVIRTQDFQVQEEIACSIMDTQTGIHYTNAGIVVVKDNYAYLLNKKQ